MLVQQQVRLAGALSALLAAAYLIAALQLPPGQPAWTGPGAVPQLVGAAWLVVSLLVALGRGQREGGALAAAATWPVGAERGRVGRLLGYLAAYVVALPVLGHVVGGGLLVLAVARLLGATWRQAALVAVGMMLFAWIVFDQLLGVPLPEGIWRDLLLGAP